jgi:hypothetical protein
MMLYHNTFILFPAGFTCSKILAVMINKVYLAHNVVSETTGSDLEKQYYVW